MNTINYIFWFCVYMFVGFLPVFAVLKEDWGIAILGFLGIALCFIFWFRK